MADQFASDHFQSLMMMTKPPFPFSENLFESSMEDIAQFSEISQTSSSNNLNNGGLENQTLLNFQALLPFSSSDNNFVFSNGLVSLSPPSLAQNLHGNQLQAMGENVNIDIHSKKRKALHFDASESSSGISSPRDSENGIKKKNNGEGNKGKRVKSNINEKEEEKPKEVVHVRARRGQATDSHSLAERVRRGKINERLRCLQDIVPGCYKTMGMAVMLDEIINYVQSLQNQVEFLSMKLTAASTFYDFNSETDAVEKLQRAKANEAKESERLIREGYGGFACFHSTWPL